MSTSHSASERLFDCIGLPPAWEQPDALPLAVDSLGNHLAWRPLQNAHALVTGPPGGSTTPVTRTLVVMALLSGWRVLVLTV